MATLSQYEIAARAMTRMVNELSSNAELRKQLPDLNRLVEEGKAVIVGTTLRQEVKRDKSEYVAVIRDGQTVQRELRYDGDVLGHDTDDDVIRPFQSDFPEIFIPEDPALAEARLRWTAVANTEKGKALVGHLQEHQITMSFTRDGKLQLRLPREEQAA